MHLNFLNKIKTFYKYREYLLLNTCQDSCGAFLEKE